MCCHERKQELFGLYLRDEKASMKKVGGFCYRGRYYEPQALRALNGVLAFITEEMNFICPLLDSILRHRERSRLKKSSRLSSI